MYEKVFEQAESFFKPMTEIFELNAEALDNLRVKQADLVNEVLVDSIEYARGLSKPNIDIDSFVETQQAYWEGLRSKLTTNAQDSYELISDVQGKVGELLQGAFDTQELAALTPAKPKAPAKKKPAAKKAAPKAAPKAASPESEQPED